MGRKKVFSGKLLSCSNNRHVTALPEEDLNYIARTTAISRDQVEAQFQKFIRIHPNGKISKKSFNEMMKECYPGADTEKLSKHMWRRSCRRCRRCRRKGKRKWRRSTRKRRGGKERGR